MHAISSTTRCFVEKAHQTVAFNFPKREYGKQVVVKQNFEETWFGKWTWLQVMTVSFARSFFICVHAKAFNELKMRAKSAQNAFVIRGFETWTLATTVFRQHKLSAFHKEAVE